VVSATGPTEIVRLLAMCVLMPPFSLRLQFWLLDPAKP